MIVLSRATTKVDSASPKVSRCSGKPVLYFDSSSTPASPAEEAVAVEVVRCIPSGLVLFSSDTCFSFDVTVSCAGTERGGGCAVFSLWLLSLLVPDEILSGNPALRHGSLIFELESVQR